MFGQFYRERSTHRSCAGFVFPVTKSDFPSPTGVASQLNDEVFYAFLYSIHICSAQKRDGCRPKQLLDMFTCVLNDLEN
jgi:hypothetical protein